MHCGLLPHRRRAADDRRRGPPRRKVSAKRAVARPAPLRHPPDGADVWVWKRGGFGWVMARVIHLVDGQVSYSCGLTFPPRTVPPWRHLHMPGSIPKRQADLIESYGYGCGRKSKRK